jgi:amyloid beta precursor protein binding protein 1
VLKENPDYCKSFSVVVVCEIQEADLLLLADICRKFNIPLVYVRSYGMFGYCRIDMEEHTIVETHPDTVIDLRLDQAWQELDAYANSFDFTSKDSHYLIHIPYPVLLLETIKRWKQTHVFPPKREERPLFHKMIKELTGNNMDDENVHEAIAHCFRLFQGSKIPSEINELLQDPKVNTLDANVFLFH